MKKRIILVVLSFVFLFGLVASAEHVPVKEEIWKQVPETKKFNLTTYNILGDEVFQIAGFVFEYVESALGEGLKGRIDETWPDRSVFLIVVSAYTAKGFFPRKFTFIQGDYRYNPNTNLGSSPDYTRLGSSPFSGTIKRGTTTSGIVSISENINLDEPFEVWYDDDSTSMGGE